MSTIGSPERSFYKGVENGGTKFLRGETVQFGGRSYNFGQQDDLLNDIYIHYAKEYEEKGYTPDESTYKHIERTLGAEEYAKLAEDPHALEQRAKDVEIAVASIREYMLVNGLETNIAVEQLVADRVAKGDKPVEAIKMGAAVYDHLKTEQAKGPEYGMIAQGAIVSMVYLTKSHLNLEKVPPAVNPGDGVKNAKLLLGQADSDYRHQLMEKDGLMEDVSEEHLGYTVPTSSSLPGVAKLKPIAPAINAR